MAATGQSGVGEVVTVMFAAAIAAYEYVAPPGQLISDVFDRARGRWPWFVYGGVAVFAVHLTRLVPPSWDIVARLGSGRSSGDRWPFI